MSQRLQIDSGGRLRGPASISYNFPFPCVKGREGNLPGTISVFNDPGFRASAHFGIDQNGRDGFVNDPHTGSLR
jgi:hypothetical protein